VRDQAAELRKLGLEVYRTRVSVPVLVELALRASGDDADFLTRPLTRPLMRETIEESDAVRARPRVLPDASVYFLRKRPGAAFGDRIGIGRTGTDVVLAYPLVSKYHAYVREEGGDWYVHDAGSRNGTFVEGARLERGESMPLRDGCDVRIGPYGFYFYGPDAFIRFLESR
jgi:hypothetical protein